MPDLEYAILSEWFDWILETQNIDIDLIGKSDVHISYFNIKRHDK